MATDEFCPCDTFSQHYLPCRHMFALCIHNTPTYLPNAISARHTQAYNINTTLTQKLIPAPHTPTISSRQAARKNTALHPGVKYKHAMDLFKKAASTLSNMDTPMFQFQMSRCHIFFKSMETGTSFQEPTAANTGEMRSI